MKHLTAAILIAVSCAAAHAQTNALRAESMTKSREQLESEMRGLRNRIAVVEEDFLEPAASDVAKFAQFLEGRDTGLTRLLPREKYDDVLQIRGGGAFYSFKQRTHEYGYGSDIMLERNNFSVGFAGANFGFITMVGDVPLDEVTTETPGVRYLATFETPRAEPEAREQQRRRNLGFEIDGFAYAGRVPVAVNKTYVLRSINYGSSDVLVAFRVVREDADGSRVLLWRLLKKFPKPELVRAEN